MSGHSFLSVCVCVCVCVCVGGGGGGGGGVWMIRKDNDGRLFVRHTKAIHLIYTPRKVYGQHRAS